MRIAELLRHQSRFTSETLQLSEYLDSHPNRDTALDRLMDDILCKCDGDVYDAGYGFRCCRCGRLMNSADLERRAMDAINGGGPDDPGQFDTDAG
jgi:hypothetical protein